MRFGERNKNNGQYWRSYFEFKNLADKKTLRKQAILTNLKTLGTDNKENVEELGDEEYNKPGEVDDNSRGVYSRGKTIEIRGVPK